MKRLILLAVCGMLFASCKKETVTTETTIVEADGTTTTTKTVTTDYDIRLQKAEADYRDAEKDVIIAREKGDTKAERAAQTAAEKAKQAWEATKAELREGAAKTKEVLKDAKKEIDSTFD